MAQNLAPSNMSSDYSLRNEIEMQSNTLKEWQSLMAWSLYHNNYLVVKDNAYQRHCSIDDVAETSYIDKTILHQNITD